MLPAMGERYSYGGASNHHCPKCGSTAYRESGKGWLRYLVKPIFLRKLRCIRCFTCFWRFSLRRPPPTTI
jgi:hypothetical protein